MFEDTFTVLQAGDIFAVNRLRSGFFSRWSLGRLYQRGRDEFIEDFGAGGVFWCGGCEEFADLGGADGAAGGLPLFNGGGNCPDEIGFELFHRRRDKTVGIFIFKEAFNFFDGRVA